MQNLLFLRLLPLRLSPLLPVLLLFSSFILIPAFALVSDFSPIPSRFFRLYSCFRPLPLYRIRSCFRFSPNPAPLLSALLLLPSFILIPAFALISDFPLILSRFLPALLLFSSFILIPAFALVSDFPPIPSRFFRLYSCFRPSLYPHSLLLTSSRHIHFFYGLSVCISRQMQTYRPGRKACAASGRAFEFRNG